VILDKKKEEYIMSFENNEIEIIKSYGNNVIIRVQNGEYIFN